MLTKKTKQLFCQVMFGLLSVSSVSNEDHLYNKWTLVSTISSILLYFPSKFHLIPAAIISSINHFLYFRTAFSHICPRPCILFHTNSKAALWGFFHNTCWKLSFFKVGKILGYGWTAGVCNSHNSSSWISVSFPSLPCSHSFILGFLSRPFSLFSQVLEILIFN